jgi:hypothetical protein
MPKYEITYAPECEQKVESMVKQSCDRINLVLMLYMKTGYSKENGKIIMTMDMRKAFAAAASAGGVDASAATMTMATQGMVKLNEKFKKDGLNAHISNVIND